MVCHAIPGIKLRGLKWKSFQIVILMFFTEIMSGFIITGASSRHLESECEEIEQVIQALK